MSRLPERVEIDFPISKILSPFYVCLILEDLRVTNTRSVRFCQVYYLREKKFLTRLIAILMKPECCYIKLLADSDTLYAATLQAKMSIAIPG